MVSSKALTKPEGVSVGEKVVRGDDGDRGWGDDGEGGEGDDGEGKGGGRWRRW